MALYRIAAPWPCGRWLDAQGWATEVTLRHRRPLPDDVAQPPSMNFMVMLKMGLIMCAALAASMQWAHAEMDVRWDASQEAVDFIDATNGAVTVMTIGSVLRERDPITRALTGLVVRSGLYGGTLPDGSPLGNPLISTQPGSQPSVVYPAIGMNWEWQGAPGSAGLQLKLDSLEVDGLRQAVRATISALGDQRYFAQREPLWTFSSAEVFEPGVPGEGKYGRTVLKGLVLNETVRDLILQAALPSFSEGHLTEVSDWGTLTIGIAMTVVPEPSSSLLMGLGGLALIAVTHRSAARRQGRNSHNA